MEIRTLRKRLITNELNGKLTAGENLADAVGITLPRFYEQNDLSQFSFRMTAAGESPNAAIQILEMDSFDEKSVHLLWNVTSDFTSIPEALTPVLTGVNSDNSVTVKFNSCPIPINSDKTRNLLPSPELSEQLLNQTQSEVQKAIDAAKRAEEASQTPAPAEIYPATITRLGGVKVDGQTITVSEDGTISAADSETIKSEIADVKSSQKTISSLSVQIAHPNNFLIYDDMGKPSVMVAVPKFYLDEVIDGASHTVHPAFIINGVEQDVIYISKYQNIVENGRAYSLPMKDPAVYINFDQAYNCCKAKGKGWHLMTNAEWAAIALWCKKNDTMPKGNNANGKDTSEKAGKAIPSKWNSTKTKIYRTYTGSGNASWYHDGSFAGIADLNGNVAEWVSGMRLQNGEIQIIENNNAADFNNSVTASSQLWRAIMPDGTLVNTGTNGTLKYSASWNYFAFANITTTPSATGSGITKLETLCLIPHTDSTASDYGGDTIHTSLDGERLLLRGGYWSAKTEAGVFSFDMSYTREAAPDNFGFRCAYYEK